MESHICLQFVNYEFSSACDDDYDGPLKMFSCRCRSVSLFSASVHIFRVSMVPNPCNSSLKDCNSIPEFRAHSNHQPVASIFHDVFSIVRVGNITSVRIIRISEDVNADGDSAGSECVRLSIDVN